MELGAEVEPFLDRLGVEARAEGPVLVYVGAWGARPRDEVVAARGDSERGG